MKINGDGGDGDILFVYAVCGLLVIPFIRASNKVIWIVIGLMLIQPVELIYLIKGIFDPTATPLYLDSGKYYNSETAEFNYDLFHKDFPDLTLAEDHFTANHTQTVSFTQRLRLTY